MTDMEAIQAQFADLTNLRHLVTSGQKVVFRAMREGQEVVLKLIKAAQINDTRTQREIAAVAKLNSAYVPRVIDHGVKVVVGESRFYLIEPFIEGETYRAILRRQPLQPMNDAVRLLGILLDACLDFEAHHLVHRDIKPENLIVGSDGKVWVIDFGIVRMLDMESVTNTSDHFGVFTLGYGAPEQIRNIKAQINSRADLFSVGVVAYEALNGSNPYLVGKRDHLDVLRHMETQDLPSLSLPEDRGGALAEFLRALTARFPSRRPQTASEAREWFRGVEEKLGLSAGKGS